MSDESAARHTRSKGLLVLLLKVSAQGSRVRNRERRRATVYDSPGVDCQRTPNRQSTREKRTPHEPRHVARRHSLVTGPSRSQIPSPGSGPTWTHSTCARPHLMHCSCSSRSPGSSPRVHLANGNAEWRRSSQHSQESACALRFSHVHPRTRKSRAAENSMQVHRPLYLLGC